MNHYQLLMVTIYEVLAQSSVAIVLDMGGHGTTKALRPSFVVGFPSG
jgi:hypothetical protein